jgi:hypothetical protein
MELLFLLALAVIFYYLKAVWLFLSGRNEEAKKLLKGLAEDKFGTVVAIIVAIIIIGVITAIVWPKQKNISVLDIELGYSIEYAEKVLEKRFGTPNIEVEEDAISMNDVEVDGVLFNSVEFQDHESGIIPSVNAIRLQKNFNRAKDAGDFLKACNQKLAKRFQKGNIPECEKEKYNGRDCFRYIFDGVYKKTGTLAASDMRYDNSRWEVVVMCIKP